MKTVIIDNYDSFTYNLSHLVKELGAEVTVLRNDAFQLEELEKFDKIILSPGPGIPSEAGLLLEVIKRYAGKKPILGVCLGEQAIGEAFGGKLTNLSEVFHGVQTPISIKKNQSKDKGKKTDYIFNGLPDEVPVGRYHSWVVDTDGFPECLEITAVSQEGLVMALKHKEYDIHGIQFHPESVLTPDGKAMIANFLNAYPQPYIINMKAILSRLFNHEELTRKEAKNLLLNITRGMYNDAQIAALLTVFQMRGIKVEELIGFREALLTTRIPIDFSAYTPIDIVGTGGDGKNTFNISTCACFIVAGAGYHVAKHGNYGATSVSGASNVIEQHGVKFTNNPDKLTRSMEECGMVYMHAQLFNPAMKSVGPVRKALQVRTIFNLLGPLVNPCLPAYQLLGVADLPQMRLYTNVFQKLGIGFAVVNNLDGYDEISLTDEFKVMTNHYETIYKPSELGFSLARQEELYGGNTPEEASKIFNNVLENKATKAQTDSVLINASFAIQAMEPAKPIEECVAIARESLESGKALNTLKKFVELNS